MRTCRGDGGEADVCAELRRVSAARDAWKRMADARGRVTYAWTDPIKDAARALLDGGKP